MKSHVFLALLASAIGAHAQTSEGFPFDVGTFLPVDFDNSSALQPGALYTQACEYLHKSPQQTGSAAIPTLWHPTDQETSFSTATINAPTVGLPQNLTATTQPFVIMMVDPDVHAGPNTTATVQLLHWLQPNMYTTRTNNLGFVADGPNSTSTVSGASYIYPQPPPPQVHRYNILLFAQPANFTVPAAYAQVNPPQAVEDRIGFNVTDFAALAGLGAPLAANYFRVLVNGTEAETSSAATATATSGVAFASVTGTTEATTTVATASETGETTLSGSRTLSVTGSPAISSAGTTTSSAAAAAGALGKAKAVVRDVCAAAVFAGVLAL